MSTASVSSVSIFQELQGFYLDRSTDLQKLSSALQSGDLSGAQQAYADLVSLGKNGPFGNSEPFAGSRRAQAFDAVGTALQAGDLAGAQAAFAGVLKGGWHHSDHAAGHNSPAYVVNIGGNEDMESSADATATPSIYEQLQSFRSERKTDLNALGQALTAGDLSGAQEAYNTLIALGQDGPFQNGQVFHNSDRAAAFDALGKALQAGDLAGAQQAFQALSDSVASSSTAPALPEIIINLLLGGGVASTTSASSTSGDTQTTAPDSTSSTTQSSAAPPDSTAGTAQTGTPEIVINLGGGSPEEIQINFGGSSASGGSLTIDVNPLQNGGEEITLNSTPGSTYQVVLNLLDPSSTSHTANQLSLQA